MKMLNSLGFTGLSVVFAVSCLGQVAGGPIVQAVITAEAHHGKEIPSVTQNDVTVFSGKEQLKVVEWKPAQSEPLQILLLMDDSSNTNIGTQLSDLKHFISGLPSGAQIGVGYMRNGTVDFAQQFTTDHAVAANKLRLPMGAPGVESSPYFSLIELFKGWPPIAGRREIIMISDGIDRYGGIGSDNPYVTEAIERAQRTGVVISSIYWNGIGHFGHSYYRINWGQNYLSQMADATGGESYWQGFGNPVSFAPYLEDFTRRLDHQYLLAFQPVANSKKGELQRIKLRTELPNVELVGPTQVWVPAP
jgi:hypothetical protein